MTWPSSVCLFDVLNPIRVKAKNKEISVKGNEVLEVIISVLVQRYEKNYRILFQIGLIRCGQIV